jgi:hypothetical protein
MLERRLITSAAAQELADGLKSIIHRLAILFEK